MAFFRGFQGGIFRFKQIILTNPVCKVMQTLPLFPNQDLHPASYHFFKTTELGKAYQAIPWQQIDQLHKECYPEKYQKNGRPSRWSPKSKAGLLFLKSYTGLSDAKLLERVQTDYAFQYFCSIKLADNERINDPTLLSRIRQEFGSTQFLNQLQILLGQHWIPYMEEHSTLLMDATCYQSQVRYPTDPKLLWECNQQVFDWIQNLCKQLKIRIPRSKYRELEKAFRAYSFRRKKSHKLTRKIKGRLLKLLKKLCEILDNLFRRYRNYSLRERDYGRFKVIKQVYQQQKYMYDHKTNRVPGRIISLAKPYLRPIKRGKETHSTEFGMKAHLIQNDGICYLEHASFDAFNESKRLQPAFRLHRRIQGKNCQSLGADRIYATNKNRRFAAANQVFTGFVKKGKKTEDPASDQRKKSINKARATRMEGKIGHHKQAYGLDKIKARSAEGELVWVFFGIMCSNMVAIGERIAQSKPDKLAA